MQVQSATVSRQRQISGAMYPQPHTEVLRTPFEPPENNSSFEIDGPSSILAGLHRRDMIQMIQGTVEHMVYKGVLLYVDRYLCWDR